MITKYSVFPSDFMFELTKEEFQNLRSQFVTSSWGGSRYVPILDEDEKPKKKIGYNKRTPGQIWERPQEKVTVGYHLPEWPSCFIQSPSPDWIKI